MKRHLTRFERLARRLIEGTFSRLFGEGLAALDLPAQLARAMEQTQRGGLAPDEYDVFLHPDDYLNLYQNYPDLAPQLAAYVQQLAQQAELVLADTPVVTLQADGAGQPRLARVVAGFRSVTEAPTDLHDAAPAAAAVQAVLAGQRIWTRIFDYAPGWLRLGIPGPEPEWRRLRAALARNPETVAIYNAGAANRAVAGVLADAAGRRWPPIFIGRSWR